MRIGHLKVQNVTAPLGICTKAPVFSYRFSDEGKREKEFGQSAYRILVSSTRQSLDRNRGGFVGFWCG